MWIIAGIILFLAFLLSLRAIVTLSYSDDLTLTLRVLFVRIRILPKKKGKRVRSMSRKKAARIRKKLDEKTGKKQGEQYVHTEGGPYKQFFKDIMNTVDLATFLIKTALGKFLHHLRIDVARFRITVATGDPASTAVAYGALAQALSYLEALIASNKNVKGLKKADVALCCDFLADSPSADIKLSFSLRVWQILHIALTTFIRLIKDKVKKASTESPVTSPKNGK